MVKIMFLGCFCDLFTLILFSKLDSTKFVISIPILLVAWIAFLIVIDCNYYVCSVLRRKKLYL